MANVTRKAIVKVLVVGFAILLLLNIPPVSILVNALEKDDCVYATADGGFVCHEFRFKDNTYESHCLPVYDDFKSFVKERDVRYMNSDTSFMFRINSRNWLKIWRYWDYLFDARYKVPFKSWNVIEKNHTSNSTYVR